MAGPNRFIKLPGRAFWLSKSCSLCGGEMPNIGENIRFQFLINGDVKCIAAVESFGLLTLFVDWVRRDVAAAPHELRAKSDFNEQEWIGNEVDIRLAGLDTTTNEHLGWFNDHLCVGDEVTIRILP